MEGAPRRCYRRGAPPQLLTEAAWAGFVPSHARAADWLFLRSQVELPFFDELFHDIESGSGAQVRIVPGDGHGTQILQAPGMLEQRADWIEARIGNAAGGRAARRTS